MSSRKENNKIQKMCFGALFAAMICLCTFISIPLPFGYFNLGDAAILLSAWIMGPLVGCISAAVGSALADILMGYVIYAPATAIIKALIAISAYFIYKALSKVITAPKLSFISRAVAASFGELIMVAGYFLYEAFVLGYGMAALASVAGNLLQGICAVIISTLVFGILKKAINKL
ncbi:MAG: ECF transporter S component [Clostridia bacterium]|nr:ECF transporter S component [Clostridia bacterium]